MKPFSFENYVFLIPVLVIRWSWCQLFAGGKHLINKADPIKIRSHWATGCLVQEALHESPELLGATCATQGVYRTKASTWREAEPKNTKKDKLLMKLAKLVVPVVWVLREQRLLLLLLSRFSHIRAHQAPPSLGFSRQEHWSGLPFTSPVHESEKWKWSRSIVSDS